MSELKMGDPFIYFIHTRKSEKIVSKNCEKHIKMQHFCIKMYQIEDLVM